MKKNSIFSAMPLKGFFLASLLVVTAQCIAQSGGAVFTAGPVMDRTRIDPIVARLPDGRIAAFGGREVGFVSCSYADFYDPSTNTFSEVAMNYPHDGAYAVKMFDGRYFIIGGSMNLGVAPGYSTCETYSAATNTFSTAGSMNYARCLMGAAQLTSGKILIAGAWYDNTAAAVGELYDTAAHTYTLTNGLVQPRANPMLLPTNDGGAVMFGGWPAFGGTPYTSVEYFDPVTDSFHLVANDLFPSDSGWQVTGFPYENKPYSDFLMTSGKYLLGIYRPDQVALMTFDPATRTFAKIALSTPIEDSFTNGGFYDLVLNKAANMAYLLGVDSGYDPRRISLVAVDLTTGFVYHPGSTFTLPSSEYPMPSLAYMPSVGKILLEGISTTSGDNFHATDMTYLILPEPALAIPEPGANRLNAAAYPVPATNVLHIRLDGAQGGPVRLIIYDIMGNIALDLQPDQAASAITVPVSQLLPGMYFYEIFNGNKVVRNKFIKQ